MELSHDKPSKSSGEPIDRVIVALEQHGCDPRRNGKDYKSRCPVHEGESRSLSVGLGKDGRSVVLNCFAHQCDPRAIVETIGLGMKDLFPADSITGAAKIEPRAKPKANPKDKRPGYQSAGDAVRSLARSLGKATASWDYHDDTGRIVAKVVRFDPPGKTKEFRPLHRDPDTGKWHVGDPPGQWPLFDLPELVATEGIVYVVEGEKCAKFARGIGLNATTTAHGARSPHKTDMAPLAGRDVIIVPDQGEPGADYATGLLRLLTALQPPARVKVVELPGLEDGDDIEQWLELHDAQEPDDLRAEIERLVSSVSSVSDPGIGVPGFSAPAGGQNGGSVSSVSESGIGVPAFSALPRPIATELRPVPGFPAELLPESLRTRALDIADRSGCSLEFVATGMVVALATVVGRRIAIRPKRHDAWTIVPNLWGMVVGRPSVLKTHALEEAIGPLKRLEARARKEHATATGDFQRKKLVAEAQRDAAKDALKKAAKQGVPTLEMERMAGDATAVFDGMPPTEKRYITNDATIEKLGELLAENPDGILQYRDELSGFLRSFDKQNRMGDLAFYLEAWNGIGDYVYDRIGRGKIYIPSKCVSMLGGIQPGAIASYLRAATSTQGDDGLISRFQLSVYPDQDRPYRLVDRVPNLSAKARVELLFESLASFKPAEIGAIVEGSDPDGIPFLRFADDAQEAYYGWLERLETTKLRVGEPPAIESHLGKYRSLMPSLALLFHVADVINEGYDPGSVYPVSLSATLLAIEWCTVLEAHARRIYEHSIDGDIEPALTLGDRLKSRLPNPFVARDISRKCWKSLGTPEEISLALTVLEDRGWIASVEVPSGEKGGRPTTQYYVHPSIGAGG